MTLLILTLLHEYSHVYRKRFISENPFDTTPSISISEDNYDDSGNVLDILIFDTLIEEINEEQAEFILNENNWEKLQNGKEFIDGFKSIGIKNNSRSVELKRSLSHRLPWKESYIKCALRK